MIYLKPDNSDPVDQGDIIDMCPTGIFSSVDTAQPAEAGVEIVTHRVIVLTQTCDLANAKTNTANVASLFSVQFLIDEKIYVASDIRGPLRSGRIYGKYFLPADTTLGLGEMVVDFHRLHTVKIEVLKSLCAAGHRPARVQPLYREHLAKHFADTFSRIGLPKPYETL